MRTSIPSTATQAPSPAKTPRPGGQPYRLQMVGGGGTWRGRAHTAAGLLSLLIPGYSGLGAAGRLRARIRCAVDAQVMVQAAIAAAGDLGACTGEQLKVLLSARDTPPVVREWNAPVPLVLVTSFYKPAGPCPRPTETGRQIVWIDPGTDWSLLRSLHSAGWISVSRRSGAPTSRPRRLP